MVEVQFKNTRKGYFKNSNGLHLEKGDIVASFKDYGINRYYGNPNGNTRDHRNTISIPRFVLAMDYKFTPKWILSAEIEFEAGENRRFIC